MNDISLSQQKYISDLKRQKQFIYTARVLLLVGFVILWEYAARYELIDDFIFSSPSRVINTFCSMVSDKTIFRHMGVTLFETIVSFTLVIFLGIVTAILLWKYSTLSAVLEPYLVVLNSLPKSALAPLLIVWLGANIRTIITAGISVAVFGTILNLYTGFQECDPDKLKLIYTLNGSQKDALWKVVLPSNIPLIISISKVNIGLSLVGVVIGEFIGAREGLGYLIIYGSQVYKLDWVILSIFILCFIAMGLYALINLIEKKYQKPL